MVIRWGFTHLIRMSAFQIIEYNRICSKRQILSTYICFHLKFYFLHIRGISFKGVVNTDIDFRI